MTRLAIDGTVLVAKQRPARRIPLIPVAADEFNSPLGRIRLIRDAGGEATQLSLRQPRVNDLRFDRVR